MIRDKFGVRREGWKDQREITVRGGKSHYRKAIDICHTAEASRQQIEGTKGTATTKQVNSVRAKKPQT